MYFTLKHKRYQYLRHDMIPRRFCYLSPDKLTCIYSLWSRSLENEIPLPLILVSSRFSWINNHLLWKVLCPEKLNSIQSTCSRNCLSITISFAIQTLTQISLCSGKPAFLNRFFSFRCVSQKDYCKSIFFQNITIIISKLMQLFVYQFTN